MTIAGSISKQPSDNESDLQFLWEDFVSSKSPFVRDVLIEKYSSFARMIAAKLYSNRHVRELEFEDFLHYALIGLIEAIDRYDPSYGVSFKQYASSRITGSILNGVERTCERQQQISLKSRLNKERAQSLSEKNDSEISGCSLFERLAEATIGLAIGHMLEGSGMYQDGDNPTVCGGYERVEYKQLCKLMTTLVEKLPDQQRRVIKYHYLFGHAFDEIGNHLGVTKGRISQIHKKALNELKLLYEKESVVDTSI